MPKKDAATPNIYSTGSWILTFRTTGSHCDIFFSVVKQLAGQVRSPRNGTGPHPEKWPNWNHEFHPVGYWKSLKEAINVPGFSNQIMDLSCEISQLTHRIFGQSCVAVPLLELWEYRIQNKVINPTWKSSEHFSNQPTHEMKHLQPVLRSRIPNILCKKKNNRNQQPSLEG